MIFLALPAAAHAVDLLITVPLGATAPITWRDGVHSRAAARADVNSTDNGTGNPVAVGIAARGQPAGAAAVTAEVRQRWFRWRSPRPELTASVTAVALLGGAQVRHGPSGTYLVVQAGVEVEGFRCSLFPGSWAMGPAAATELGVEVGQVVFGLHLRGAPPTREYRAEVTDPANPLQLTWRNGGAWFGLRAGVAL